jgi:hypothetical protein
MLIAFRLSRQPVRCTLQGFHMRRVLLGAAGGVLLTTVLPLSSGARAAQPPREPPLPALLAGAGRYVQQLEQDFSTVISDEQYEQKAVRGGGRTRKMRSEMSFMWLPDEETWLTVRTVLQVDGEAVGDSRARLDEAIAGGGPGRSSQLRRLRDEGARFNIGGIRRNFSDPMLALQVAGRFQPRFTFALEGHERVRDVETLRLSFVERGHPTLIQRESPTGDLPARGDLWIGAADGVVHQTRFVVDDSASGARATIVVVFGRDEKLSRWLPVRMDETYAQQRIVAGRSAAGTGVFSERIECVARYSNYRRFETSGRLITP